MIAQTIKLESSETKSQHLKVAYMGTELSAPILNELPALFNINKHDSLEQLNQYLDNLTIFSFPDVILLETDPPGECFTFIEKLKKNPLWRDLIVVIIATEKNNDWKLRALQLKVHDYYSTPFPVENLVERLNFLVKFRLIKAELAVLENADVAYKLPLSKIIFDLVISAIGIILLSPLLILVAIIIRLDTKGPVIYKSKRVGTGYNIFSFYKFSSMRCGADSLLDDLSTMNRYSPSPEGAENERSVFVKIKSDPRITRFGHFIRNTSIDELPQLFNVMKGDMSLVGNRPLPLYEAEMLTSNEWSLRFMGPAGVTGLWQIRNRGKRDVSERERKKLDNFYALKYSFWFDLEILIKTVPAIFHKKSY